MDKTVNTNLGHGRFKEEYREDIINGTEVWVHMKKLGYTNYDISSLGKVRKTETQKLCIITKNEKRGYYTVRMKHDDGTEYNALALHQYLAQIFIDNPDHIINTVVHIDGNKYNNDLSNLMWANRPMQIEVVPIGVDANKFKQEYRDDIMKGTEIWVGMSEYGFSNYEISSFGNIMSQYKGRLLSTHTNNQGYFFVSMTRDGDKRSTEMAIHRLLATVFLEPPGDDQTTVDHIDRNIENNRLSNLRWATPSLQSSNRGQYSVKCLPVIQYDKESNIVKVWESIECVIEHNPSFQEWVIRNAIFKHPLVAYDYIWARDKRDMTGEEWKTHPVIEGVMVSNKGRVKGSSGNPTTGHQTELGSYTFTIKKKKYMVHNLVASTFLDNYDEETMIVYHKDGDNSNNDVSNLCTRSKKVTKRITKKKKDLDKDQFIVEDLENEKWYSHPTIEKLMISDKGRVKYRDGTPTYGRSQDGYYFCTCGTGKGNIVHDLIAETLIEGYDKETTQVYHKDGNSENNCVENIGLRPRKTKRKHDNEENNIHNKKARCI